MSPAASLSSADSSLAAAALGFLGGNKESDKRVAATEEGVAADDRSVFSMSLSRSVRCCLGCSMMISHCLCIKEERGENKLVKKKREIKYAGKERKRKRKRERERG